MKKEGKKINKDTVHDFDLNRYRVPGIKLHGMIITLKKDCIKSPQHMRSEPTEKSPYSMKDIKKESTSKYSEKPISPIRTIPEN